jgi:hypothetical protein
MPALDYRDNRKVPGGDREFISGRGNDLIAIDYPTLALFTGRYQYVKETPGGIYYHPQQFHSRFQEWMLDAGLDIESIRDKQRWAELTLKSVRDQLRQGQFGIFSPAFRRFETNFGSNSSPRMRNGDGFSVTTFPSIFDNPPLISQEFRDIITSIREITSGMGENSTKLATSSGDDVVMPGWLGNGNIDTGSGDDIILSSPQMHAAVAHATNKNGRFDDFSNKTEFFSRIDVYYPTAYALRGTKFNRRGNTYSAGRGEDLIYFDAATSSAYGQDGADVFAPSFGSFNWGIDTLIQHSRSKIENSFSNVTEAPFKKLDKRDATKIFTIRDEIGTHNIYAPFFEKEGLLSPLSVFDRRSSRSEIDWGSYTYESRVDADVHVGNYLSNIKTKKITPSTNSGVAATSDDVSENEFTNVLGGQQLYGGPGNDTFYGIDPNFYKGFIRAGNGRGLRVAFQDEDERRVIQNFRPVQMLGGPGADYFSLGNPGNLTPENIIGEDYLYRISGNGDTFERRDSPAFGDSISPDVFEFNLTYEGESWKNSVVTTPGSGTKNEFADYYNATASGLGLALSVVQAFGINTPIWGAVSGVANFIGSLFPFFSPKEQEEISFTKEYYRDPLKDWRKVTKIWDWDPSDAIVLRVDPADPRSNSQSRWENIEFNTIPVNSSNDVNALDITYQNSNSTPAKSLVRLEKFFDPPATGGAWQAYDFLQQKQVRIGTDHLGFFGQLSANSKIEGQKVNPPAYTDETGFNVEAGDALFRWTDSSLKNKPEYQKMRQVTDRIVLQLDTKKLGYYWDIKYKSERGQVLPQNPSDLSIDKQNSKLWIRQPTRDWTFYTLAQTETNPVAKDAASKAQPQWIVPSGAVAPRVVEPVDPPLTAPARTPDQGADALPFKVINRLLALRARNGGIQAPSQDPFGPSDPQFNPFPSSDPFGSPQGVSSRFDVADPFFRSALPGDLLLA